MRVSPVVPSHTEGSLLGHMERTVGDDAIPGGDGTRRAAGPGVGAAGRAPRAGGTSGRRR